MIYWHRNMLAVNNILFFTIFRYFEFGISSFLFLYLANIVTPDEYGTSSRSFILITLSAFLALGTNQVVVKWFGKFKDTSNKFSLILFGTSINFIASIVALTIVSYIISEDYWFYSGLIASGKLVQENFCTINRIHKKLLNVNIIYLSNVLPLALIFLFLEISTMHDFFRLWSFCIWFSVLVSLFISSRQIKQYRFVGSNFKNFFKNKARNLILDGVKLASIGLLVPLISSGDKLLISFMSVNLSKLGNLQLADNIAMVISYGFGAIVYAITPTYLDLLRNKEIDIKDFFIKGYLILIISIALVIITIQFSEPVLIYFFPNYDLVHPLTFYVLTKTLISGMFMFNISVLVFSDELRYIKLIGSTLIIFIILVLLLTLVPFNDIDIFYLAPICGSISMMFLHFMSISSSRRFRGLI